MKLNVKKTEIFLLDVLLFEVIFTLKVVPKLFANSTTDSSQALSFIFSAVEQAVQ